MDMTSAQTTAPADLFIAENFTQTNPVAHIVTASTHGMGVSSFCTGRHLSWMVRVSGKAPTCKACVRKAGNNGIDINDIEGVRA